MGQKRKTKNDTIPKAALPYLRRAGWMPKRVVPTAIYEQAYDSEGVPFLPKTKQFLGEFGGLMVSYETQTRQEDVLEFLAERAVQRMGGSGLKGFEELIGVAPLCPIGHYLFGTRMLFMDARGQVYGGCDESVLFIGKTGKDAIGNILTGVDSEVLEN